MLKVTLLGDSIRQLGYGNAVPDLLKDEFEVWQPGDNCRFAQYTLRGLHDWKNNMEGSRIVHWNNGLWDTVDYFGDGPFTPVDQYVTTMIRLAELMKKKYGTVIFATTTPVRERLDWRNEDILRYNAAVVPELKARGVIINDLHSLVAAHKEEYIRDDDHVHLTEAGIRACGEQVANVIREVAKTLE